jgi:putative component of toxin-antitoxin plasmid stabilization module
MHIFALKEIKEITGKLKIFMLIVDGKCLYEDFESEINKEGNLKTELNTIETRLYDIADCKSLPVKKFRDITPKKINEKEYEIKTANLRVYMFHEKNTGRIIVCGGKKNSQKSDIRHFRNIKKEYFLHLK